MHNTIDNDKSTNPFDITVLVLSEDYTTYETLCQQAGIQWDTGLCVYSFTDSTASVVEYLPRVRFKPRPGQIF